VKIVIIKLKRRKPRFKTIILSPERIRIVMQSEGTHSYIDSIVKFIDLGMKVVGQNQGLHLQRSNEHIKSREVLPSSG
jgi:hypothetical protein